MFLAASKVGDSWHLDILGVTGPLEKNVCQLREQKMNEDFMKTVRLTEETTRCIVDLPWKNDHAPISSNYSVVKLRI